MDTTSSPEHDATVVIATRNRLDHARRAVATALAQEGDIEVLVLDDASDDGSGEVLAREYPTARVERSERQLGVLGQRNRGGQLAGGRILFSLDDDAELPSTRTVRQTIAAFDDERIGAVTVPLFQPGQRSAVFQQAPDGTGRWCTFQYIAAAAAIRADLWQAASGYRPNPARRVAEEQELMWRLMDAGYVCRLGTADPAVHHEASAGRDMGSLWRHDVRNEVLHSYWYAPGRQLPERLARVLAYAVRAGIQQRHLGAFLRGFPDGLRAVHSVRGRDPIEDGAWRASQRASRAPVALDDLARLLPAPDPERLRARVRRWDQRPAGSSRGSAPHSAPT